MRKLYNLSVWFVTRVCFCLKFYRNLLHPAGVDIRRAIFKLKIFQSEDLPQSKYSLFPCLYESTGLFPKERFAFRKSFRNAIRFLIGFVIWTTCVHKHYFVNAVPITNRICALRGNILFLLRSPRWLTHAWLQRAFPNCTRTNHVPKELCVRMSSESSFLRGSRSKRPFFRVSKARFQKPDLKELWELCVHKG